MGRTDRLKSINHSVKYMLQRKSKLALEIDVALTNKKLSDFLRIVPT